MSGCIEETFPTNTATEDQLASSAKATEALLYAMPAFANKYDVLGSSAAYDWGYGSIMHIRDVMTEDMAIISNSYDWYTTWHQNGVSLGEGYLATQFIWNFYWKFVQTANNMIAAIDPENATDTQKGYLGVGYAFRAFQYIDMAQMFEFLENDVTSPQAAGGSVLNLTVPIVTESITEEEARNNPRATREEMAAFILSDLQKAEEYIPFFTEDIKTLPHLDVVYGLFARYYLWLADYPNAAKYARLAIDESSVTPMTQDGWLNTSKGFNDISKWMWGSSMMSEDDVVQSGILNWTSWMSNETTFGYASAGPFSMISVNTYNRISDTDFRKLAWKAPAGSALDGKSTYIDPVWGAELPEYASLKFRPAEGNMETYSVGAASAYPLMRIEEMFLIEAEATAHFDAWQGKVLLEAFMTSSRDPKYTCRASDSEAVAEECIFQKRIELWGEGISYFDVKRLDMSVTRGYSGTNFPEASCFNTDGRPGWMNFCIIQTEKNNNKALVGFENPSPSGLYKTWTGQ
jgi:hypothetical protein